MRPPLHLTLFGGFEARWGPGPPVTFPAGKVQALLASLALPPGRRQPRDKLAALLWGDLGETEARASLRQALFMLRKAVLASPLLITEKDSVTLDPAAVEVDVVLFERRIAEGTMPALQEAAHLYRGDLLAGLAVSEPAFEEWLLPERERLREQAMETLARLLAHQRAAGVREEALQTGLRLLALDPLQEAVHRTLMRLYTDLGRRAAAHRQYQQCVALLQRDLGTEPEQETRRLYEEILQRRTADRADARVDSVGSVSPAPSRETPLIGRDTELARLRRAFDEAVSGQGRVVIVVGEAGIGKTAVLQAFAAEAGRLGGRILLGRSYESEQILPFGPWLDAFRAGHVVLDEALLGELAPVWRAELARLFPEVAAPGLPSPSDDPRRLFESVAQVAGLLATVQPLVLLLEDLHWADEMSARLLCFLGRRLHRWPMLVIATAREEDLGDAAAVRETLAELRRDEHFQELTLSGLSAADTATLVRSLTRAGGPPAARARLEAQIWRISEGNPFVVVETLRALADVTSLDPAAPPLARRVRETIAGRLERLSDRGRELAELAAVIGRDFDFALLQQASRLTDRDAAAGVEELVRRRILHGAGEGFEFTHDRIRQVVYEGLLPPRRRLLHREIAGAVEQLHAGRLTEQAERLAHHTVRGELWEQAVGYSRQAGSNAFDRSANREAVASFDQALVALAHLPQTPDVLAGAIDIRLAVRSALLQLAELPRIGQYLREAEALATALGDRQRLAWVWTYTTIAHLFDGDPARALAVGERALALAEEVGDVGLRASARTPLAHACRERGDFRRALTLFREAIAALSGDLVRERLGQAMPPAFYARSMAAFCLAEVGEFGEAARLATEAATQTRTLDLPFGLALAHMALAHARLVEGRLDDALAALAPALEVIEARALPTWYPWAAALRGHVLALAGAVDEGRALLERALERAVALPFLFGHSQWVAWLAHTHVLAGRADEARRLGEESLALSRRRGERGYEAWALHVLGEAEARLGPRGACAARAFHVQSLALADELGMRPLAARCRLALEAL